MEHPHGAQLAAAVRSPARFGGAATGTRPGNVERRMTRHRSGRGDAARGLDGDGLLAAVLEPSSAVESGYRELRVDLLDGTSVIGLLVKSDDATLTVRPATSTGGGDARVLRRSEVGRLRWSKLSIMPEGLLESLAPQQAGDLLAFLLTAR